MGYISICKSFLDILCIVRSRLVLVSATSASPVAPVWSCTSELALIITLKKKKIWTECFGCLNFDYFRFQSGGLSLFHRFLEVHNQLTEAKVANLLVISFLMISSYCILSLVWSWYLLQVILNVLRTLVWSWNIWVSWTDGPQGHSKDSHQALRRYIPFKNTHIISTNSLT